MKIYKLLKQLAYCLLIFFLIPNIVQAQIPVADAPSVKNSIQSWFESIKESQFVISTTNTIAKTSSAIGAVKSTISEYVLENKRKIEEKLAKVEKYKKRYEEYKKQYEEYKKLYEELKEEYENTKEKIEEGIETVKNADKIVKGVVDNAKSKVNNTLDGAKNQVNSVTNQISDKVDSVAQKVGINTGNSSSQTPLPNTVKVYTNQSNNIEQSTSIPEVTRKSFTTETNVLQNDQETPLTYSEVSSQQTNNEAEIGTETNEAAENKLTTSVESKVQVVPQQSEMPEKTSTTINDIKRKTFTITDPQASLLDIKGYGKQYVSKKLAYAFALKLQDDGTDVNGNFIIPPSLAMYCGLNSETAQEEGKVDSCLRKINQNAQQSRTKDYTDAPEILKRAEAEYAAAVIAEAYKAKNDSEAFEEKILDPIEDAPAPQILDIYSNVVEVNKAVVNTINSILKIQSARLALKSFENYYDYTFLPPEEEEANES